MERAKGGKDRNMAINITIIGDKIKYSLIRTTKGCIFSVTKGRIVRFSRIKRI